MSSLSRAVRLWVCASFVSALASGCAGYRLGDAAALPFRTVYVAPPVNTSLAPQVAALVGAAVIRNIDRAGTAAIGAEASSDALLTVTITDYRREVSAERSDDTGLGRKWRVTLFAECTLTDRRSGKVYFSGRPVSTFDEVYADSGLVPAEYQNMPVLAGRLGEEIARAALAVW